jgi:hypothetical protein
MKIRITILSILLILLIVVPIAQTPKTIRDLRIEFEKCALTSFRKISLERLVFYLTQSSPSSLVRNDLFLEERMPTWHKLMLDLYIDPTLAEYEPYIYASKLLRKNLKSRNKRKFFASLCLSYFKPDTGEARCIEEYAHEKSDEETKSSLLYLSLKIEENFYKMQYGLLKDIGLIVILPQMSFLERPPEADMYMSIYISKDSLLSMYDALIPVDKLPGIIKVKTNYEKYRNFCILFHTDEAIKWEFMWKFLGPLIELSKKSPANIEFFFTGRIDFDAEFKPEPYELGIKFEIKNKPLKNIDIDIHMDQNGYFSINGKEEGFSFLENLPPNKTIRFTFSKLARMEYVLAVLSLIKKSNPKDYYYVVE